MARMIEDLMTQVITIVAKDSGEARSPMGSVLPDDESSGDATTCKAYLEPFARQEDSREDMGNRNTQIGDWLCVVPSGTDVDGWERVEWNGRVFEITGPPSPLYDPSDVSAEHHLELGLREVV